MVLLLHKLYSILFFRYVWSVGTEPGLEDVVEPQEYSHKEYKGVYQQALHICRRTTQIYWRSTVA